MRWIRGVSLSCRALARQRVRTALALVGTAVGGATLLAMMAVGEGAERKVVDAVRAMGRNLLVVNAAPAPRRGGREYTPGATVETLSLEDAAAAEQSGFVVRVAPSQDASRQITALDRTTAATVRGTTPEYERIRAFPTASGRYFTAEENRAGRRVAVLGDGVARRLFPNGDPIGQVIRVGRIPFEVVGVLVAKGISVDGAAEEDNQILIPVETALRRVFRVEHLRMLYLEVSSPTLLDEAAEEVAVILRERHRLARSGRPDDFTIQNQRVILDVELATVAAFRTMIVGMGAAALAVGGVGVLSIMLLSVRARRAEIGLRMAVGARRRDVGLQFLLEAVAIGGAGGFFGVALGTGASWIVSRATEWTAVVTPAAMATAVGSALVVATVSGAFPAARAARLEPVDALRM